MAVDKETVAKIARLARIRVGEAQQAALAGELSSILGWVEQLGELKTEGVEPMTSVVAVKPTLRSDEVSDGDCAEQVLANAPGGTGRYFAVPKVVE